MTSVLKSISWSLLKRGLEGKFQGEPPALEGEIALAYGPAFAGASAGKDDELAPARELAAFVKKFSGGLAFAGGVFQGKYVGKDGIISIAAIPGLDVLRAQFVYTINGPIQKLAVVLNEVAKKR